MALSFYSFVNRGEDTAGSDQLQATIDNDMDELRRRPTMTAAPPPSTQPATQAPTTQPPTTLAETPTLTAAPANVPVTQPATQTTTTAERLDAAEVMSVPDVFVVPVMGEITRGHHPDRAEFSIGMRDFRTHSGIDIAGNIGTQVRAVNNGVISDIFEDPLMGFTIVIAHAGGIESVYQNLQPVIPQAIRVGASVRAGEVIGGIGESSIIEAYDGPHLHFEMLKNGVPVDPRDFIDFD